MNTLNIERYLRVGLANSLYAHDFKGVLPKEYAQQVLRRLHIGERFCMVANTQPSTHEGEHWVAYLYDGRTLEFFDSYGNHPAVLRMPYVKKMPMIWNRRSVQSWDSDVCGQFCIYYLCKRARNVSMSAIVNPFSSTDLHGNDRLVAKFACRKFKLCSGSSSDGTSCMQTCVSRKYCRSYCCNRWSK